MKEKIKNSITKILPPLSRKEECVNEIIARQNEIAKIDMDDNIITKYTGVPDANEQPM